ARLCPEPQVVLLLIRLGLTDRPRLSGFLSKSNIFDFVQHHQYHPPYRRLARVVSDLAEKKDPVKTINGRTRSTQNSQHGLNRLTSTVKALGGRVIDRRTALGKSLARWRDDLLVDLGGPDAVSVQERAIVDLAVRTKLLLDSIDAWLLVQPSLV